MNANADSVTNEVSAVPVLSWGDTDVNRRRLLHARRAELVERDRRLGLEGEVNTLQLKVESLIIDVTALRDQLTEVNSKVEDAELTLRSIYSSKRWHMWSRFDHFRGRA